MVLGVNFPLVVLVCMAVSLLIAGTLHSIKFNVVHRPAQQARLLVATWLDFIEAFFWVAAVLLLITALPHPTTVILVTLLVLSLAFTCRHRYDEEKSALNRWIPIAIENDIALAPFLDEMSNGYKSRIARRAKACVMHLLRGEPFIVAARRAKLPVGAETIAAISSTDADATSSRATPSTARESRFRDRPDRHQDESQLASSYAIQQFAYVVVTVILAWLIGWLIREYTFPSIRDLIDEFAADRVWNAEELSTVVWLGNVVAILLVAWLLMLPVVRWFPFVARFVPWFGRAAIDRWRCDVLDVLGSGMRAGQSEKQILGTLASATRVRWIRKRCLAVDRLVEQGMQLSLAMRRGKLISKRELDWLTCAEENGNLPESTERLSAEIRRRDANRWRTRMAWFVPVATVLVGGFILAHAVFLFDCFVSLVDRAI